MYVIYYTYILYVDAKRRNKVLVCFFSVKRSRDTCAFASIDIYLYPGK